MHINIVVKKDVYQSNMQNINKNQLKEIKEDLILKTINIGNEINKSKDYICTKSLKRITGKLFESIETIEDLENYLEEQYEK